MSIELVKSPERLAFIGNELMFDFECTTPDQFEIELLIADDVKSFAYLPFGSQAPYRLEVSFTDILQAYFKSYTLNEDEAIITPAENFILDYSIRINNEVVFEGKALQGGLSKQAHRTLIDNGLDLFTLRLQNTDGLFLFTNRTNNKLLQVREKELYPFIFLHSGQPLAFVDSFGNRIETDNHPKDTVCSLDVIQLLNEFKSKYGNAPRTIDVVCNSELAFTLSILASVRTEEVYHILFKNSLGAFEKLEVTGVATHKPKIGEENSWQTITDYDFYETHRDRLKIQHIIEVESGYKSRDEQLFILDAVISEESYFIYPDGTNFRCSITAEDPSYRHRMITPNSMLLSITAITEDQYTTPMLLKSELDKFRIFNDMFNDMFN